MKLPQILATTDVPVPSASTTAPDVSGVAVAQAQGIGRLGEAVSGALLTIADVQEKRREQERATDALKVYGQGVQAVDEYETELETGRRDLLGNMVEAPATNEDYVRRWDRAWQERVGPLLSGVRDPDTQRRAQNLLERERIQRRSRAVAYENKLFLDSENAGLDTQERVLAEKAALDPDESERTFAEQLYMAAVAAKEGVSITKVQAGDRRRRFSERVVWAQAGAAIRSGTFNVADYQGRVPAEKLGALIEQDTRQRKEREDAQAVLHARMKDEAFGEYYAAATHPDGPLITVREFRKDNEFLKFSPAQQKAIVDTIEGRDVPDDPMVLKQVRLRSTKPDLSQADIDWLNYQYDTAKTLSGKTWEAWRAAYISMTRANVTEERRQSELARRDRLDVEKEERYEKRIKDVEERERRRERKEEESRALEDLRRGLHVNSVLDQANGASTNAYTLALERFRRRMANGEDPHDVAEDERVRHLPLIQKQARDYVRAIRESLTVQSPEQLGTFEQARASGYVKTLDDYDWVRRKMREAERIEEGVQQLLEKRLQEQTSRILPKPAREMRDEGPITRRLREGQRSKERGPGVGILFQ